jgi:hypothetical protein
MAGSTGGCVALEVEATEACEGGGATELLDDDVDGDVDCARRAALAAWVAGRLRQAESESLERTLDAAEVAAAGGLEPLLVAAAATALAEIQRRRQVRSLAPSTL